MRFWIVLMTICSLLSLPFSGSMAADSAHHTNAMQSAPEHSQQMAHGHHMPAPAMDDAEHCPVSMPAVEMVHDCCEDTTNGPECGSCPPDCGHCVMSDHGSTAALPMQQTFTHSVVSAPVVSDASFYQRLSGQPTPPPIIS